MLRKIQLFLTCLYYRLKFREYGLTEKGKCLVKYLYKKADGSKDIIEAYEEVINYFLPDLDHINLPDSEKFRLLAYYLDTLLGGNNIE